MVSMGILALLLLILASVVVHTLSIFQGFQHSKQTRQSGIQGLDMMAKDLQSALFPTKLSDQSSYQMIQNPSFLGDDYSNRDSLFWQGMGFQDDQVADVVEFGYFIQWIVSSNRSKAVLRRMMIASDDKENYLLYRLPRQWLSEEMLTQLYPGDLHKSDRGVIAENVIALWITLYGREGEGGQELSEISAPFDSRAAVLMPCLARISLVTVDDAAAAKITPATMKIIRNLYNRESVDLFVKSLPREIRSGTAVFTTEVALETQGRH